MKRIVFKSHHLELADKNVLISSCIKTPYKHPHVHIHTKKHGIFQANLTRVLRLSFFLVKLVLSECLEV